MFALCFFVANSLHAAPRIHCDDPTHDFGTVIGRAQISHEFMLWNRGDEPLEIVKIKDCCGVKSTVEPMTIPPGSNAVCTSVFTVKNRYGTQDKQILLITNDKKNLYFDLRLTGTLLKPVECSPRLIRLGSLLSDSAVSQTITATNLLEEPVTLGSVSATIEGLAVEIVESKERSWKILLKNPSSLPSGRLAGRIELEFSSGTVNVPVVGTVEPVIQTVPKRIPFPSRSAKETGRMVMLRSSDGRSFEILSATLENADGSVEARKLAEGKWQCRISVKPDSIRAEATLKVTTTSKFQPLIEIPLWVK